MQVYAASYQDLNQQYLCVDVQIWVLCPAICACCLPKKEGHIYSNVKWKLLYHKAFPIQFTSWPYFGFFMNLLCHCSINLFTPTCVRYGCLLSILIPQSIVHTNRKIYNSKLWANEQVVSIVMGRPRYIKQITLSLALIVIHLSLLIQAINIGNGLLSWGRGTEFW